MDTSPGNLLLKPSQRLVTVAEQEVLVEQKAVAPQWNVGYGIISLRPASYTFQNMTVGVNIPLFRKPWRATVETARLKQTIAETELQAAAFQIARQRDASEVQLRMASDLLDSQGNTLLQQAAQLRRLSDIQLRSGESDFIETVISLESAVQSELEYLTLAHRYNLALVAWAFWRK
jgi:cobalt-zinc-cadmium resistance protein CzcA